MHCFIYHLSTRVESSLRCHESVYACVCATWVGYHVPSRLQCGALMADMIQRIAAAKHAALSPPEPHAWKDGTGKGVCSIASANRITVVRHLLRCVHRRCACMCECVYVDVRAICACLQVLSVSDAAHTHTHTLT